MATEVSKDEYRSQERKQAQYERDVTRCENIEKSLDEDIRRLKKALETMRPCNSDFKSEYSSLDKTIGAKYEFSGRKKDFIIDNVGNAVLNDGKYARDNVVNHALDEMEWLLTKKQNEWDANHGDLLGFRRALRSIGTWLRTHFFN